MKKVCVTLTSGEQQEYTASPGKELSFQVTTDGEFFIKEQLNVLFHRRAEEIKSCYLVTRTGRFIAYKRDW